MSAMTTEYSGTGDPERSLALLWRKPPTPSRGPKPRLTVDRIVRAAVEIADVEGLDGLSMRRIAKRLGVGAMSLYTYVPSKGELLEIMLDEVIGETLHAVPADAGWRARLEAIARQEWELIRRHPWVLQVSMVRPPLGPNTMNAYESALAAVDGIGLSEQEMARVVNLVTDYARGAARGAVEWTLAEQRTGVGHDEWWSARAPFLDRYVEGEFPVSGRVADAGVVYPDPEGDFEFGLQRVLDGVELLVSSRAASDRPSSDR